MAPRAQVPVLLLTGSLGSEKTRLLARWLTSPEFSGAAVIVNELGETGLDDSLVQTSSDAPERTPCVAPEGAQPPRTGLTIFARGAPAGDISSFIGARAAIATIGSATQSTGAHA